MAPPGSAAARPRERHARVSLTLVVSRSTYALMAYTAFVDGGEMGMRRIGASGGCDGAGFQLATRG